MIQNPPANAGDVNLIPGWGRSPGEESGNTLQDSCLSNPTDRGIWWLYPWGHKESDMIQRLNNNIEIKASEFIGHYFFIMIRIA